MDPKAAAIFRERGIEVDEKPGLNPDELAAIISGYDGLAVRSSTRVNAAAMDAALPRLKVIGRAGIGVDTIDVPAASARGIVVMNTPFGNSITTAEHAIAMLFALRARDSAGRPIHPSREVGEEPLHRGGACRQDVGLIGCGNIGSIVADRAHGLKMKVVAFDPFLSPERAIELGVEKVELDDLLPRADFITLHTPLTDQTRKILSREALGKTKPGVRIVNCARGGLIDEAALKDALEVRPGRGRGAGRLFGRAREGEPAVRHARPDLHAASRCVDQRGAGECRHPGRRADERFPASRRNHQRGERSVLSAEEAPRLKPYMGLAEKLGRLIGQIAGTEIRSIDVEVEGAAAELNIKPITGAVLAGLCGLVRHREHGQRAVPGEGAGDRRSRNPARARRRLSHASRRNRGHGARAATGRRHLIRQPRAATRGNLRMAVEAELTGQMIYIVNSDAAGNHRSARHEAGRERNQHRDLQSRPSAGAGGEAIALVAVDDPYHGRRRPAAARTDRRSAKSFR